MRAVLDVRYLRGRPSGIGAYASALATRLPQLSPHDNFHYWAHPLSPSPVSAEPNVSQEVVSTEPNSPRTLLSPSSIASLKDVDVFHCPHNILGFGIACPTVVTVHDVMWLDEPELIDPWLPRRAVRKLFFGTGILHALKHATRLLTVSKASADAMARVMPSVRGRVEVTYNAADPYFEPAADRDLARARAATILGTPSPYFLLVGQNQPSKGHELAIRAFAAIAKPHERLVLVQRSNPKSGLARALRELRLGDRVIFTSTLPPDGLVTLMQGAIALLQPSFAEGFGMPALEAMASGCPVIASDIAPLVEVLGGSGLHARLRDVADLGRNMRRLADDPSLQDELRAKGLERAGFFSWDETAEIALETYRLAARKG